jgi:hypothetical protein
MSKKKVKRSKSPLPEVAGGGVKRSAPARSLKNGQDSAKILSNKRGKIPDEVRRVLDGPAPEIAHPEDDPALYVAHCRFVNFFFKEMFERVGSANSESAREARAALMALLFLGVTELTAQALDNNTGSAQWAWRLLANLDVWIEKNREKFGKAYEEYRRELSTVFRNDVWEPESPFYKALHKELWLCQFYRGEIPWPKYQQYLRNIERSVVPAEYESIMKLPPLSLKSWKQWDKELWPLFKKNNPQLPFELQKRYNRVESRWSKYHKEFRQHLYTIAKAYG